GGAGGEGGHGGGRGLRLDDRDRAGGDRRLSDLGVGGGRGQERGAAAAEERHGEREHCAQCGNQECGTSHLPAPFVLYPETPFSVSLTLGLFGVRAQADWGTKMGFVPSIGERTGDKSPGRLTASARVPMILSPD